MDKIFRVEISGYVIQKEYLNHPSEWDWSKVMARWKDFVDVPSIKITAMVDACEGLMQDD